jgi:hypothetical protein
MVEIRKIIATRETILLELGVAALRPIARAVGMAVILNPFAGRFVDDLRPRSKQGHCSVSDLCRNSSSCSTARLSPMARAQSLASMARWSTAVPASTPCSASRCGRRSVAARPVISSNVKVAAAGATLDVPLGHKDDSWSFPHFDTITVSVADAPRPNEILVVMAIADGGRLRNRCGTEPIR